MKKRMKSEMTSYRITLRMESLRYLTKTYKGKVLEEELAELYPVIRSYVIRWLDERVIAWTGDENIIEKITKKEN